MTVKNLGLVQAIWKGTTPPINIAMIWYDMNLSIHKYYDTNTSSWVAFILNNGTLPIERVGDSILLNYDTDQFELVGGSLTIKANVLASVIPPFPISDITGLQAALDSKVDKVIGKSLILDSEITRLSTVIQYTHPNSSATAGEYKAFTLDQYGHVTAVNDAAVVHILDEETIIGIKSFTTVTNFNKIISDITSIEEYTLDPAISGKSITIGVEGWGAGDTGVGVLGKANLYPVEGRSTFTTIGNNSCFKLSSDYLNIPTSVGYGLTIEWNLPSDRLIEGVRTELISGIFSCLYSDITINSEFTVFDWYLLNSGNLERVMQLDGLGKLSINSLNISTGTANRFLKLDADKNVISSEFETIVYTLLLPASATVIGRCEAAVEGIDYPTGWVLGAYDLNPHDLVVTHNLNRHIVDVTVYSYVGTEERKLISNAAYAGIVAPDMNSVRVENLATVPTDLLVHITLSNRVNE